MNTPDPIAEALRNAQAEAKAEAEDAAAQAKRIDEERTASARETGRLLALYVDAVRRRISREEILQQTFQVTDDGYINGNGIHLQATNHPEYAAWGSILGTFFYVQRAGENLVYVKFEPHPLCDAGWRLEYPQTFDAFLKLMEAKRVASVHQVKETYNQTFDSLAELVLGRLAGVVGWD